MSQNIKKQNPLIIETSGTSVSSEDKQTENTISSKETVFENESISSQVVSEIDTEQNTDKSMEKIIDKNDLKKEFDKIKCNDENFYSNECNKFLLKKEFVEREYLSEHSDEDAHLYPNLNDTHFNIKISSKKEFNDTKYDGTIHENIKEQADLLANAGFELQPHQAFVKNFMSFQTPYSSLLLYHGLGSGKCHAKGTPILMADGKIKLIENITEGELIMGDDSRPRTVLSLAKGIDKMYDIIPDKGEKYTVNQEHILCLKAYGFPKLSCTQNNTTNLHNKPNKLKQKYAIQWIENNEFRSKTFTYTNTTKQEVQFEVNQFYERIQNSEETNDNVIEISVKDYLDLSNKKKKLLKGYKVPIEFTEKKLGIDPYRLGYWLGCSTREKDTSDLSLHMLNNNKHIPSIYKCNSRENRLQLLAGLLDSNKCVLTKKGCVIQYNEKKHPLTLMEDIIYLTRSLGFDCYKSEKNNTERLADKVFKIHISGSNMEEIPRKKIFPSKNSGNIANSESKKQKNNDLVSGIKVKYVDEGEYYGFTLDGNCRYLMGDFTVTHNTCSAIGVCEEMRDYMKQVGISKRIIIVASENVQDNFKLQLFDERKLKLVDGIWNIKSCVGNKLLKEVNPMNMKGLSKEKLVSQIKNLINTHYIFLGYVQFANYIIKTMNYDQEIEKQGLKRKGELANKRKTGEKGEKTKIQMLKDVKIELNSRIIKRLQSEFDNRLIVIDEVHNIRKTDDNENKKVAINLELLIKSAKNMRFLLLSATPMYNSYKEIVWILNLMNTNDRRGRIEVRDVFDKNGDFKKNGEELLIRKATGYISFVRGENPYTFPYRVYPNEFSRENTFPQISYPSYQMNLKKIKHEDKKRVLSLYLTKLEECGNCGKCQRCAYKYIIYNLRNKKFSITTKTGIVRDMPDFENMESFGYTLLQTPLESLIISYPVPGLKAVLDDIPEESVAEDFSPSFSESIPMLVEDEKNQENLTIDDIVINQEDSLGSSVEEGVKESELSIPKTQFKPPLIIEYSDDENSENPSMSSLTITDKTLVPKSNMTDKTLVPTKSFTDKTLVPSSEEFQKAGNSTIDPHQLTGKLGLERMMNFIDQKSPPLKGDYEYKKTTLDNYGKIFSRDLIGKYSSKIKNILDNIVDKETGKVSDGVILIYSQYIDSGLIPMALALEEMGFTRYGQQGIKPLFKNKPTEVVDVRTMKLPEDKKNFVPARYAMITGETRLSPNNDFEVKGLTGEDNKDGNKVKVVLISKAGSEGIDLKFIRQVHILEPWYNMNRLEQIIGRAVRNFSHKDLPFEKRNVQIFMYGTILGNNKEEAADLYVYRVAEYKAVQMGKVTRVLKETAVDCIINHDQTNFTKEIMSVNVSEPITQVLSNGMVLDDYKVGDAPFSPACDYMAQCNYNCRPYKHINGNDLNEDTYNENFMIMNSEKILQRIRMLMKESFFYKKDLLLQLIRTPKEYPYVQIYSALTQLIDDESEFITDKYGRNGRLVNIGEYYLFQPIELRDKNASVFERSVPIDYKHDFINFEIKKKITKQGLVADAMNNNPALQQQHISNTFEEGKKIMDQMKVNFDISREFTKQPKVPRGDDNWYKHCGIVMRKMTKEYPESKEHIIGYLVAHMIELLLFEQKLAVMNYLYSLETITQNSFEWFAKEYFEINSVSSKNYTVFIMYKLDKRMIMILNENNMWVEAEPEDQREIVTGKFVKDYLTLNIEDYNQIIGFIGYEKKNNYLVFKTKDMKSTRDTGARCDESGKVKTLQKLNEIVGETKYTNENTKIQKDENGNVISEAVGQVELCVLQEFILRYYNTITKNDKKWIFTPEMAIWHKLYKIFV